MNNVYVIVYGDMFEGFQGVVGSFETEEEAAGYMESHNFKHFDKSVFKLEEK